MTTKLLEECSRKHFQRVKFEKRVMLPIKRTFKDDDTYYEIIVWDDFLKASIRVEDQITYKIKVYAVRAFVEKFEEYIVDERKISEEEIGYAEISAEEASEYIKEMAIKIDRTDSGTEGIKELFREIQRWAENMIKTRGYHENF